MSRARAREGGLQQSFEIKKKLSEKRRGSVNSPQTQLERKRITNGGSTKEKGKRLAICKTGRNRRKEDPKHSKPAPSGFTRRNPPLRKKRGQLEQFSTSFKEKPRNPPTTGAIQTDPRVHIQVPPKIGNGTSSKDRKKKSKLNGRKERKRGTPQRKPFGQMKSNPTPFSSERHGRSQGGIESRFLVKRQGNLGSYRIICPNQRPSVQHIWEARFATTRRNELEISAWRLLTKAIPLQRVASFTEKCQRELTNGSQHRAAYSRGN